MADGTGDRDQGQPDQPTSPTQAKVEGTSILAELPAEAGGGRMLFVDIAIECPICGSHRIRIAGHHLTSIQAFLGETIKAYPDLVGAGASREGERSTMRFGSRGAGDPSVN